MIFIPPKPPHSSIPLKILEIVSTPLKRGTPWLDDLDTFPMLFLARAASLYEFLYHSVCMSVCQ